MSSAIEIVWEYVVEADSVDRFREAYGPDGAWAALFRRHSGYEGTRLFQDCVSEHRFLTVDCWRSEADFDEMRRVSRQEYEDLDAALGDLTISERKIGVMKATD